ncbi:hypothetical protein M513_07841 [Trichuris suis]|uniref:Uncharacterized protein n=1 Tax=Trichuris suis TaxID=68888 RepID=A0A085M1Z5_9BILA|nr:hypothetical protein M513_07841 [Trichuris suis]
MDASETDKIFYELGLQARAVSRFSKTYFGTSRQRYSGQSTERPEKEHKEERDGGEERGWGTLKR